MTTADQVKLIQTGNIQTLTIPPPRTQVLGSKRKSSKDDSDYYRNNPKS
ncbi:MAG: hypothetical protein RID09_13460 [Coleofasciculus sp. G1-WW12-02]